MEKYLSNENADCDLDFELLTLRRKYSYIKKERQQNQKDVTFLENKMKLLMLEEQKAIKREEKENKKLQELEKTRLSFYEEREKYFETKLEEEQVYLSKKDRNDKMRERLRSSLKIKSDNLYKKKNEELSKMKQIRKEINETKKIIKQEFSDRKQKLAKFIKEEKQLAEEKKKRSEVINQS